jgi:shikimate dehydrogenase
MIRLGLTGYPLGHSLSPTIHAAALDACGLEGEYCLYPIPQDDDQALKALLARLRSDDIRGLNVTIPHKQNVMQFLDELTPTAKSIGAVNTVYTLNNRLIGDNSDAPGFLCDLKKALTTETRRHRDLSSLVLGAGGSARAVVSSLLNDGWDVTIAARRSQQAEQLSSFFTQHKVRRTNFEFSDIDLSNIALIVNTTPIGMTPAADRSPWPANTPFPKDAVIYDLVYNPRETKLVREAREQGLQATTGLGMLIEQAALSFEIWTGHKPPREIMRASVEHTLLTND